MTTGAMTTFLSPLFESAAQRPTPKAEAGSRACLAGWPTESGESNLAKLVLSLSGNVLNQYFTDKPVITIGRSKDSDIAIHDALLSREHARINTVGEDHIIEDMQSSNGTLVNGIRVTRKILRHRDVIGLGAHTLQYVNTRKASDVDLDRTMVIQPISRDGLLANGSPQAVAASARATKKWLPEASVRVLHNENTGNKTSDHIRLERVVTTFGTPGSRLIVITRRPQGYFLTHVEGSHLPKLNDKTISADAHQLRGGDVIEGAGCKLEFLIDEQPIRHETQNNIQPASQTIDKAPANTE